VLFPLAAGEGVPKNSRLGFAAKKIAPHQGSAWPNSGKALGIEAVLWEDGVRSDDGARYYNPTLQRFISEDPTDFLGGINLYAYAGNNPIGFSDPVGLKPSPGRSGQPRAWVWVPEGNGEPGHYVLVLQSDSPLTDEQRLQTVAQQTVRLAQGPMNVLTVVAGAEAVVIVGVEAGPAALNAYEGAGNAILSVEATFPGATAVAADVLDVLGPNPAIGATKVGIITNLVTNVIPQVYDFVADHTWRPH